MARPSVRTVSYDSNKHTIRRGESHLFFLPSITALELDFIYADSREERTLFREHAPNNLSSYSF